MSDKNPLRLSSVAKLKNMAFPSIGGKLLWLMVACGRGRHDREDKQLRFEKSIEMYFDYAFGTCNYLEGNKSKAK